MRKDILKDAMKLATGMDDQHSDLEYDCDRIAQMWGAYLGTGITPRDAATMIVLMEVAKKRPWKISDDPWQDWVTICAHAALAGDLEEGDKIAREVREQWAKAKAKRDEA